MSPTPVPAVPAGDLVRRVLAVLDEAPYAAPRPGVPDRGRQVVTPSTVPAGGLVRRGLAALGVEAVHGSPLPWVAAGESGAGAR